MKRRVVVTGLGVVAPNGIGKESFWSHLVRGKSALTTITCFDPSPYPCKVAAEIRNFRPAEFMRPARSKHRGRFSQFAVAAAKLAVLDAALPLTPETSSRAHVCIGTSMAGIGDVTEGARNGFARAGFEGIPVMSGLEYAPHAPAGHVSAELGIRGQALTVASACATGLDAIQWAAAQISADSADAVVAGATDAPLAELAYATLSALGILTKFSGPPSCAARPYDFQRDGIVLGEGAGVLVLEELDRARARNAPIYAEVLGFGSSTEGGYGIKTDSAELALADAIHAALAQATLGPTDVDYIGAHGVGLPDYDLVETRAFKRVFGDRAYNIPISSIKSMIGHAMGAASALQVAAGCLTLQQSIIPPTINLDVPDPECDLDYVPHRARIARIRHVLVNAHAMGGTHSVMILGSPPSP